MGYRWESAAPDCFGPDRPAAWKAAGCM